jgi:hypothetical protein
MSTHVINGWVLATTEPWFALPPTDSSGPAEGLRSGSVIMILLCAGFAAALLAWYLVVARPRDRARGGPLVRALTRSLGVDAAQRRFLNRVARSARLPNAGCLLISRGCFDHAARRFTGHADDARRLREIRRIVFGADGG